MPKRTEATHGELERILADMIETSEAVRSLFSEEERRIIVKALRDRARWMASDITSGERRSKR